MLTELEPLACAAEPPRAKHRILIVEDDATLADVLALRLERVGYQPLLANSGNQGLELARTQRPHLVLLDLNLPDVDGLRICESLADHPQTCSIPVIILSGMERPDIVRSSRAAGCHYFMRKPYDPNALLILIQHAISETESWDAT